MIIIKHVCRITDALNMTRKNYQSHIRGNGRRETTPLDADYLLRGYDVASLLLSV